MKDIQYWLTVHWPPKSGQKHEGVFIHRHSNIPRDKALNAARQLKEQIRQGDLVFVYETIRHREDPHRKGKGGIVALIRVKQTVNPIEGENSWIRVTETGWIAEVDCPLKIARQITGLPLGYISLFGNPVPKTNVQKLDNSQAVRLLGYVCNLNKREMLIRGCLQQKAGGEEEEEEYQERARLAKPKKHIKGPRKPEFIETAGGRQVKKDPRIAKIRFETANYKCELNPSHQTFTSLSSKNNFVEAHHLVPARVSIQEEFGKHIRLDHESNIVSLCPNCHRLLHHAISDEKKDSLRALYKMRKKELEDARIHITIPRLFSYYK